MTRSIATTMASGTFSMATNRMSGFSRAVSAVKRPLPQPSSTRSSLAPPISASCQRPRRAKPSFTWHAAHFSIRGIRFFFFRIRIAFYLRRSFRLIVPRPGGKGKGLRPLSGAAAFLCRLLPEDAV